VGVSLGGIGGLQVMLIALSVIKGEEKELRCSDLELILIRVVVLYLPS